MTRSNVVSLCAARAAQDARAVEFEALAAQAARLGVLFDAGAALAAGMSPDEARARVLEEAAERAEARTERRRRRELTAISEQAYALDIPFSLIEAIETGMRPDEARRILLDAYVPPFHTV